MGKPKMKGLRKWWRRQKPQAKSDAAAIAVMILMLLIAWTGALLESCT